MAADTLVRELGSQGDLRLTGRSSLKVLCIDDDLEVLDSLSRQLHQRRAKPLQALHGMQGFWLACTEHPDVIVVDLAMPRGNGAYVVECLRRNSATREIPIIVLSGSDDLHMWTQVEAAHVEATLSKPVSFDELFEVIQSLATS